MHQANAFTITRARCTGTPRPTCCCCCCCRRCLVLARTISGRLMRSCATYLCPEMADRTGYWPAIAPPVGPSSSLQPPLILIVSIVPESRAQSAGTATRHAIRISSREVRIARRVPYRELTRDGCRIRDVTRVD